MSLARLSRLPTAVAFSSVSRSVAARSLSTSSGGPYSLPPLPYDYGALEPAISGQIMETHHKKHHQTYVNNLNAAVAQLDEAKYKQDPPTKLVQLQSAINFNGGGHINHSIFWTNLAPTQHGGGNNTNTHQNIPYRTVPHHTTHITLTNALTFWLLLCHFLCLLVLCCTVLLLFAELRFSPYWQSARCYRG